MSPLQIKILLHYYTTPGQYDGTENVSFQEGLCEMGMLDMCEEVNGEFYSLSEKGYFYVRYLKQIPIPESKWVIPKSIATEEAK